MTLTAEDFAPREARIEYEKGWPAAWEGKPWPWCSKAEREVYRWVEIDGKREIERGLDGEILFDTIPAVPHDTHIDNGGNTRCPGVPGIVPAKHSRLDLEKAMRDEVDRVDHAAQMLRSAEKQLGYLRALAAALNHQTAAAQSQGLGAVEPKA